jgi:hypothetical protein
MSCSPAAPAGSRRCGRADLQVQRHALRVRGALADRLGSRVGDGDLRRRAIRCAHAEQRMQLAAAVHLADDVGAADQLAFHVKLRNRRPLAVGLDAFADLRSSSTLTVW